MRGMPGRAAAAIQVVLGIVFFVAAVTLLCSLLMSKASGQALPSVFGHSAAVVTSGSMEPSISVDDVVVLKSQDSYSVGDVVTFASGSSLVTHRIVGESGGLFVTQGDANNAPDLEQISYEAVVGKVIAVIPVIGVVMGYLKTPEGIAVILSVGLLLVASLVLGGMKEGGKS